MIRNRKVSFLSGIMFTILVEAGVLWGITEYTKQPFLEVSLIGSILFFVFGFFSVSKGGVHRLGPMHFEVEFNCVTVGLFLFMIIQLSMHVFAQWIGR